MADTLEKHRKKTCPYKDCGAVWVPRKPNPVKCPRCTRPLAKRPAA
jgi:hypothetical protein